MRFVDEETGEAYTLFGSKELVEDLAELDVSYACNHESTEVRSRKVSGGAIQVRAQCLRCGRAIGNPVKQSGTKQNLQTFDEETSKIFEIARNKAKREVFLKHLSLENNARHLTKSNMTATYNRRCGKRNVSWSW